MLSRIIRSLRWRAVALHEGVLRALALPTAADYTARLLDRDECSIALDIGCGASSHLTAFRNRIKTVGVDSFQEALEVSRTNNAHDEYILADVLHADLAEITRPFGGQKFDLVTLYGGIEHFPKDRLCAAFAMRGIIEQIRPAGDAQWIRAARP